MTDAWKPIERMVSQPIWVLKYDIHAYPKGHPLEGNFCDKDEPMAVKFTDCHGWYSSEADALKVMHHFPKPCGYRLERVWKRELL